MILKSSDGAAEWAGYVSHGPNSLNNGGSLEPLSRIRLEFQEEKGVYRLTGTGSEGTQNFTLSGELNATDTAFTLRQQQDGSTTCHWAGFATPFGLVGALLPPNTFMSLTGFVWMWDESMQTSG